MDNGQPDYRINEHVAYDYIRVDAIPPLPDVNFDCIYFGTLAQRNSVSRDTLFWILAHLKFKTVFYDVNLRKGVSEGLIIPSLTCCDIFKLNSEEVGVLSSLIFHKNLSIEAFAREISQKFNINVVIITAAEKGCYIYQDGLFTFIPGEKVQFIDGVGAGDAFSAAFLFYFMQYGDALKSARIANKLGAFVASRRGAIPAYSDEIRTQLNRARLQEL
jgi:fructokinase